MPRESAGQKPAAAHAHRMVGQMHGPDTPPSKCVPLAAKCHVYDELRTEPIFHWSQTANVPSAHADNAVCDQAKVGLVKIKARDGRVGTLGRIVDASGTAWFSVRQASRLLLSKEDIKNNRLACLCKKGLRRASPEEALALRNAKVVSPAGKAPALTTAPCLMDALRHLRVSAEIAEGACEERAPVLVWSSVFSLMHVWACLCVFVRLCVCGGGCVSIHVCVQCMHVHVCVCL
jgi:hypothetical protein